MGQIFLNKSLSVVGFSLRMRILMQNRIKIKMEGWALSGSYKTSDIFSISGYMFYEYLSY